MFSTLRNAISGFWSALTGPSRSGVSARLRADTTAHEPGQATNLIASLSTFATNGLHALTVRTRRVRTKLRRAVLDASARVTIAEHAMLAFLADPDVAANAAQAVRARTYRESGKRRFLDVRVRRALLVLVAAIVAVADFGFMAAIYRDLFVLSLEPFQITQLGEWAVALTLPLLFPIVVIALAEFAGKSIGRGRARRMHPERAEQIFGKALPTYTASWGGRRQAIAYVTAALLIGAFFFVMAIHRFGTAASNAGLDFPTWALAVGYGALPLVALLVDIASRDVVLEHDRQTLAVFARNEKRRDGLERAVLQAREGLTTAWLALKWRVVRIAQDANQSIVMFEQLVTDAYAGNGAIGPLAPLTVAGTAGDAPRAATADAATQDDSRASIDYSVPSLEQQRSLTTPLVRWLALELEADLEVLRRHNPDADAARAAAARVSTRPAAAAGHEGGISPAAGGPDDVEVPDTRHSVIEFPDRHSETEAAS